MTLRGELPAVANFLAGVEYGDWQLAVSSLEVRGTYSPRLARAGHRGPLTITLQVSGVMQGAAPPMVAANKKQALIPGRERRVQAKIVSSDGDAGE